MSSGSLLLREITHLDAVYNSNFNAISKEESEESIEDDKDFENVSEDIKDDKYCNDDGIVSKEKENSNKDINSANLNASIFKMENDLLPLFVVALNEINTLADEALTLRKNPSSGLKYQIYMTK